MTDTWMALILPPLALLPAMGLLSRIEARPGIGEEAKRKLLHVGAGLMSLSLPAFFDSTLTVLLALAIVITWMFGVRKSARLGRMFGGVLHDLERKSCGEFCFAVALAWLLIVARDNPLHYILPVLILSLADAAAAMVGKYAPRLPLGGPARGKTMSGCATFFGVSFLTGCIVLVQFAGMPTAPAAAVALLLALNTTVAEAVSHRGLDNVTVPLVAWATLVVAGA